MANEQQYYNPIIQAMVQSVQAQQNQQRLDQEMEVQKQNVAASKLSGQQAQQAHDLAELSEKHHNEHENRMLDIQDSLMRATQQINAANRIKTIHDIIMHGGTQQEVAPIVPEGSTVPNSQDLQASEIQRIQGQAQAQSAGQSQGALLAEQQLAEQAHQNRLNEGLQNHAQRLLEIEKQGGNAMQLAKIHGSYQQSVASIEGANHLRGIALMHQLGIDDGSGAQANQARDIIDGVYDGNIDWSKLSADQKRAASAYATANGEMAGLPTNTAAYSKKLETMGGLQSLVSQYRDLAQNYSVDSPGSTGKGNYNVSLGPLGTHGVVLPGSDLKSKLENVSASGGKLATFYDQQSRKSDAEILRQVSGWFDPSNTVAQNQQKVQANLGQLQDAVKSNFAGMKTDRINKILGDRGITDFGAFQPKVYQQHNVNPQTGQKLGTNDGINWFDRETGQPYKAPVGPAVQ